MDCDINLDMIDAYLIQQCEQAEYCAAHQIKDTTEYIIRIEDKVYVLIVPEKNRK
jgi:hypothetical protein